MNALLVALGILFILGLLSPKAKREGSGKKKEQRVTKTIKTKVAGVTHKNDDGAKRQKIISRCKRGDVLLLRHDPLGGYPNAVAVFRKNGQQLGYLRDDLAGDIVRHMTTGRKVTCKVLEPTGGRGRTRGCNIEIRIA